MLSNVVLFSQRLTGRPCILPAFFQPGSISIYIARLSLRCLESSTYSSTFTALPRIQHIKLDFHCVASNPTLGRPLYCIFPLIFRHSQPRSSRFLLLCLLFLSSQPTPGSIQFFDSFSSDSQLCLFSFHCFPCAAISHPLDPSSVTLPSFQTSVVSPFFPDIFFQVCLWPLLVFHPHQRRIHSRIVQSRLYSCFSRPCRCS